MEHTPYFGTNEPLPPSRLLKAGELFCLHENGNLRYIRIGKTEVLRMIYSAVRDADWQTAPYQIENEVVEVHPDSFRISYTAHYEMGEVQYKGTFLIEGKADSSLTFRLEGEALSDFQRNRIGICVLHPITECQGKPVRITHPDGTTEEHHFPDAISPHQPFFSIQKMEWPVTEGVEAELLFAGDVFETEDQRNWTDDSYKTYSTPLDLPKPVLVKMGDTIRQEVELKIVVAGEVPLGELDETIRFELGEKVPFPQLGYARSTTREVLTDPQLNWLRQLPFDHYRVEVKLYEDWEAGLSLAANEARQLGVPLEVILFFGEETEEQLPHSISTFRYLGVPLASILVLHRDYPATPEGLLKQVYPLIKETFAEVPVGYGTDKFFTELNRNRPSAEVPFDFISYSLNPQVHASDTRTLIENAGAQQYTLSTAATFSNDRPVHVSPVTLKWRHYPDEEKSIGTNGLPPSADARQFTGLAAAWTLLSLRYLSGAARITYYETVGVKGVLPAEPAGESDPGSAVFHYLKMVKDFAPKWIIKSQSTQPLRVDGLVLENAEGERMAFLVNFEEKESTLIFKGNVPAVTLPSMSIKVLKLEPE
ncbi:hypothetical protein [Telluribacter sp.]|jgi:hypothetical protein|uniref:hypothetical protein n=1 Tax=Telluribacter sp. TaxID=1978767 RepID=UPI002E0FFEF8|nr:hypothetical protein [Telluribacter sp.]